MVYNMDQTLVNLLHRLLNCEIKKKSIYIYKSIRLFSVLRGHSFFSSSPQRPMTSDSKGFSIPDFIHYIVK